MHLLFAPEANRIDLLHLPQSRCGLIRKTGEEGVGAEAHRVALRGEDALNDDLHEPLRAERDPRDRCRKCHSVELRLKAKETRREQTREPSPRSCFRLASYGRTIPVRGGRST